MKLKKMIMSIVLNICKAFLIFTKINPHKITFISLESDKLENDFKLIYDKISSNTDYEIKLVLHKFEKNLIGYFKYFIVIIKQFFEINTSKLVILDYNNFAISHFKRKEVNVLQLWHSSGAIKKFGNEVARDYKISNYNYAICNSNYFKEPFSKAFDIDIDNIMVTGIPKTDCLFDDNFNRNNHNKLLKDFPKIRDKKVVLYAPTFRGRMGTSFSSVDIDLNYIADNLGDEYIILYKGHPLLSDKINFGDNIIDCSSYAINELYSSVDYLISDYSAIIIDFSLYLKPMLFYIPDFDEYSNKVGLFVDYKNIMPGPFCYNEKDIINNINQNNFNINKIKNFRDLMFSYLDGNSCERVISLIEEIMKR